MAPAPSVPSHRNNVPSTGFKVRSSINSLACTVMASKAPNTQGGTLPLEENMAKPSEKEIAARAYQLWEENGRPDGKEEEFWHAAEQQLLNEDRSNPMRTPDTL